MENYCLVRSCYRNLSLQAALEIFVLLDPRARGHSSVLLFSFSHWAFEAPIFSTARFWWVTPVLPGCSRGRRAVWGCTVTCLSNPSALQFCTAVTNAPFILNLSSHSSLLQFPEIVSWPSVCLAQAEQQPVTLCQVYLSPRLPHVHHSHPDRFLQEPLQGKPVEILLGIQRGCVKRFFYWCG